MADEELNKKTENVSKSVAVRVWSVGVWLEILVCTHPHSP